MDLLRREADSWVWNVGEKSRWSGVGHQEQWSWMLLVEKTIWESVCSARAWVKGRAWGLPAPLGRKKTRWAGPEEEQPRGGGS